MHELWGTFGGRWYVTGFLAIFLWRATVQLGWRRTAVYSLAAFGVGALAENLSVNYGFPYTRYAFNPDLRGHELWIVDVPLFVPLSYALTGYFAFAAARIIASGPWRTRARRPWQETALGILLAVWAVWILDPAVRRAGPTIVGDVFRYDGPGFWFGLPLASQVGYALTAGLTVVLLARMTRAERDVPVASWVRHPDLVSLVTYVGEIGSMAVLSFAVGADTLGGAALLILAPAALITAIAWSNLRPVAAPDGATVSVIDLHSSSGRADALL